MLFYIQNDPLLLSAVGNDDRCYEVSFLWVANARKPGIIVYQMHEICLQECSRMELTSTLIVPRPPGHLQTTKNLFSNILQSCRHFRRRSESKVSNSQALSFWTRWRAFIDHKRPIKAKKTFALSFFSRSDLFSDLFFYWAETAMFIKNVSNNFVYWSDGLGSRTFDHHNRHGGGAFANKKCPQSRAFD